MPTQPLTFEFIQSIFKLSPPTKSTLYFDDRLSGFLIELRPTGNATYYLRYRDQQKKIKMLHLGLASKTNLEHAREQAHELKNILKAGGDPKLEYTKLKKTYTFAEFIESKYMPFARLHKRSWFSDESVLRNHLLPAYGQITLDKVSSEMIMQLHQSLAADRAASTANRILILTRSIYNYAIKWGVLPRDSNPCAGLTLLPDNGARERYLTEQELKQLFQELENNPNKQVAQVIKLLFYTGARKREILDARWENIDLNNRILTVPLAKSGKARHIPLSDAAYELIIALPRSPGVPWLFFNPVTKKPLVSIFGAWNTIRNKVGLPELRLHDLRHSFASFLVNNGRTLYEVQQLLGHHDPKITMRYAHLAPQSLITAANVVGSLLDKNEA